MKRPSQHLPAGRYLLCSQGMLHVPGAKFPAETVAAVIITPFGQPTRRQRMEAEQKAIAAEFDAVMSHETLWWGARPADDATDSVVVTSPGPVDESWVKAKFVEPPHDEAREITILGVDLAAPGSDTAVEATFADGKMVGWREVRADAPPASQLAASGTVRRSSPFIVGERPAEQFKPKRTPLADPVAPKAKPIDTVRLAAAYRTKASTTRAAQAGAKKAPLRRALGTGPCHKCGASGRNGCDHFLPYQGGTV